jgi:hypothetical protein
MGSPKGQLGGLFEILWFDKSLLILNKNFNKNYRLPLKRLYGRRILGNYEEELNASQHGLLGKASGF